MKNLVILLTVCLFSVYLNAQNYAFNRDRLNIKDRVENGKIVETKEDIAMKLYYSYVKNTENSVFAKNNRLPKSLDQKIGFEEFKQSAHYEYLVLNGINPTLEMFDGMILITRDGTRFWNIQGLQGVAKVSFKSIDSSPYLNYVKTGNGNVLVFETTTRALKVGELFLVFHPLQFFGLKVPENRPDLHAYYAKSIWCSNWLEEQPFQRPKEKQLVFAPPPKEKSYTPPSKPEENEWFFGSDDVADNVSTAPVGDTHITNNYYYETVVEEKVEKKVCKPAHPGKIYKKDCGETHVYGCYDGGSHSTVNTRCCNDSGCNGNGSCEENKIKEMYCKGCNRKMRHCCCREEIDDYRSSLRRDGVSYVNWGYPGYTYR